MCSSDLQAGEIAKDLGTIFGNTFSGLGGVIKANVGPGSGGQILLDYFKDATANFKDFATSVSGQSELKAFFKDSAENTKSILEFAGGLVKEFLKLGSDPNTKKFWDTLQGAVQPIGQIFQNLTQGGPAFANLLVTLSQIMAILSEAGGFKIFFDTLNAAAQIFLNVLNNPIVQDVMKVTAKIHGFLLAIGTLGTAAFIAFKLVVGTVRKAMWVFNGLKNIILKIGRAHV